jgi:hypothetical protein
MSLPASRPIRLAAISDLHGYLPDNFPECDIAVIAGDICPLDDHSPWAQHRWLRDRFGPWLHALPAGSVLGIAGNHDLIFERDEAPFVPYLPWSYLQDELAEVRGLRVWGSPWIPWLGRGWAFQAPKSTGECALVDRYDAIPDVIDVLVSHTPPRSHLDRTILDAQVGSTALLDAVHRARPRLLVCGHVHEARGASRMNTTGASTLIANVSAVNFAYEPYPLPVPLFEIPSKGPVHVVQ